MVLAMPSPPDLTGLTALQQVIVLIISTVAGALVWVSGLLKPKTDQTSAPNIIALENDRRDAEILDKVRDIMEAKAVSASGELKEVKDDVQNLEVRVAVLESRVDRPTRGRQ